ncbi:MAG: hypothetical protein PHH06_01745 [Candidatus Gracilibacteria bacterium]|nr:hypothetical protein [Candidatus Gracilibacteria bacterium]
MSEIQNNLSSINSAEIISPELAKVTSRYSHIMLKLIMGEILPGTKINPGELVDELTSLRAANDDYYRKAN